MVELFHYITSETIFTIHSAMTPFDTSTSHFHSEHTQTMLSAAGYAFAFFDFFLGDTAFVGVSPMSSADGLVL